MLFCIRLENPAARFVVYSTEKYAPVVLDQVKSAKPGWALAARFKGIATRAPSPTTGVGDHVAFVVPLPHCPRSFAPHIQTEPSALTAMLW